MSKKRCIRLVSILLLGGLLFGLPSVALATAVDRMSLCNLEGHPGETIEAQITLSGTDTEERSGYWYTRYKELEGDDERMDITSWITIEPEKYTITQGESIVFNVTVKIPGDATPGLWGATSEEAGKPGHSAERRTYIVFNDTITGGNVYSGLLIPVSVVVLEEPSPPAPPEPTTPAASPEQPTPPAPPQPVSPQSPALSLIMDNIIIVVIGVIIIILLAVLLIRVSARKTG